ncbi:MAG: cytochrome bc complex cytochrome b subunit [Cyanobacteria bacterium RM1_2_2]|nr:cytochrome bc complex cytochrome b subunit [Cyanobacteria bacterium RM1_2_2]
MKTLSYSFILRRLATLLAVIALTLVLLAGITGVLLAFYYEPSAGGAYDSLKFITESVPGGVLIRSLHDIAGNLIIGVALLQIAVMFLGRQANRDWFLAWLSGGFLALFAIGLGWTAIILDWDQIGYWRLKIEIGTISSLPIVGEYIRTILLGGDSIGSTTVAHMYAIHSYLLSAIAVVLAIVHFVALVNQERRQIGLSAASEALPESGSTVTSTTPEKPEPVSVGGGVG